MPIVKQVAFKVLSLLVASSALKKIQVQKRETIIFFTSKKLPGIDLSSSPNQKDDWKDFKGTFQNPLKNSINVHFE